MVLTHLAAPSVLLKFSATEVNSLVKLDVYEILIDVLQISSKIAQVKNHLRERFINAFFSKFCQPKSCLCPWKRINTWNVCMLCFQRQNAVRNRTAKWHCEIAQQNCTEKLHYKIALQNCNAKMHCEITMQNHIVKLQCETAMWNRTAKSQCEIALRNRTVKSHCEIALWNRTWQCILNLLLILMPCDKDSQSTENLSSTSFKKFGWRGRGGRMGSLWTNVSERVSVKKTFFLCRSCCAEIS